MKTQTRARFVLLALLPFLGCGVIAWQGAHRPERMILGKWKSEGLNLTIEIGQDGTYSYVGYHLQERNRIMRRVWGRYCFDYYNGLGLLLKPERGDQAPVLVSQRERQRSAWVTNSDVRGDKLFFSIQGDAASVGAVGFDGLPDEYGRAWKRIE